MFDLGTLSPHHALFFLYSNPFKVQSYECNLQNLLQLSNLRNLTISYHFGAENISISFYLKFIHAIILYFISRFTRIFSSTNKTACSTLTKTNLTSGAHMLVPIRSLPFSSPSWDKLCKEFVEEWQPPLGALGILKILWFARPQPFGAHSGIPSAPSVCLHDSPLPMQKESKGQAIRWAGA